MEKSTRMLVQALACARRGWHVFPVHNPTPEGGCSCGNPGCQDVGKHPRITGWKEKATTDEATIRKWWEKWPDANIGIATGARSGFFALDEDGETGAETLAELERQHGPLPGTVVQVTGSGGRHLLFTDASGLRNAVGFAPGLDVRTDGGYIVGPGSLHANGRRYEWAAPGLPDDVELADAPDWLLNRIKAGNSCRSASSATVGERLPKGKRNSALTSLAGSMRCRGMSREAIEAGLLCENAARCDPPLPEDEVRKIAASVARYPQALAHPKGNGRSEDKSSLWKQWVAFLEEKGARLIWTDKEDAYFQLPDGEVLQVQSEKAARLFQRHTVRDAYHGSKAWARAAGGLRSWIEQHGKHATVYRQVYVAFQRQIAYVGCEDGRTIYCITPHRIDPVSNGSDGILIVDGCAPLLDDTGPTGELMRWVYEDTWAKPVTKVVLVILAPMMALGAETFPARPIVMAVGPKGSGKTTTWQILGAMIFGKWPVAQGIKTDERENECRVLNEPLVIFDNMDASRSADISDFLAGVSTQQERMIRKMRVEGELVKKPVIAFTVVTSFTIPACLKRADVLDRTLVLEFDKTQGGKARGVSSRALDCRAAWGDILTLIQRVLRAWPGVPDSSELRSIEFMQFAHALLPHQDAERLEQTLLDLQAITAGHDDPVLEWIEAAPPPYPMIARDLYQYWGAVFGQDRPRNPRALGCLLRDRAGILGNWLISGTVDRPSNSTLWSIERAERKVALTQEEALALLRALGSPGDQ